MLVVTGRWELSVFVGAFEFTAKVVLFWVQERAWKNVGFGRKEIQACVIWFTGLSGSGKTTISDAVAAALLARGLKVEHLDGDQVRRAVPCTGFTRPERIAHIRRVGYLASRLEEHGVYVVASLVSPYREARESVRRMCRNFVEVHLSTPLQTCEQRDVKGLYASARSGAITAFTGISDPYEVPTSPELVIDTAQVPLDAAVNQVLTEVQRRTTRRIG